MQYRILALAIVLAVPAASAWGMKGNYEPDTALDRTGGFMKTTVDTTPCTVAGCSVNTVYFNAIQNYNLPPNVGTPLSANLATLQTQQMSTPYNAMALLGVWKDCNNDGFVGLADNGLFEYRSTVLDELQTAGLVGPNVICPVQSFPTNPASAGYDFKGIVHNDGTWVHEFIAIGYDSHFAAGTPSSATSGNTNLFHIEDASARVWGDFGLPGAPAGNICWINPSPPGMYHSVGSIEDKMDCYEGNAVAQAVAPTADPATSGAYSTVRAVHNPWGEPSGGSDATVMSCSAPIAEQTVSGNHFAVRNPAPSASPPTDPNSIVFNGAGVGGTAREVGNEADDCNQANDIDHNQWEYQVANAPYSQEQGSVTAQIAGNKIQSDQQFKFNLGQRNTPIAPAVGATGNEDGGTNTYFAFGVWRTNTQSLTANQYQRGAIYNPGIVSNPATGTAQFGVQHQTYYAKVNPNVAFNCAASPCAPLVMPGSTGTYGAEACHGLTSGNHGGWECSGALTSGNVPQFWYRNVDGTSSEFEDPLLCKSANGNGNGVDCTVIYDINPDGSHRPMGVPMGAVPGWTYNLRDVDCFDQSVGAARDAGVSWGTLTGTHCA